MIGLILAAGTGRRLKPDTDNLPKTLLPISGELTILDRVLSNLAAVGVNEAAIVIGHAATEIRRRGRDLESRHGVRLHLIPNDRTDWNNAYSLWLARDHYAAGALLVNGDTVHPPEVEKALLAQRGAELLITVDSVRQLSDEAMKVRLDQNGLVARITKQMSSSVAHGEYLGAAVIEPGSAPALTEALEATWRHDPDLYYEDGFQLFADRGGDIRASDPGAVDWVEVDDHADLKRAREIACRY